MGALSGSAGSIAAAPSERLHAPALWLILSFGALLAGWGELSLRLVASQLRLTPRPIFIDPASVWMAPIAAASLFGVPVGLAWLAGRLRRSGDDAWRWALTVSLTLALFDVLLLVPRVHPAALIVVAAGVAVQAVRFASRSAARTRTSLRWLVGGLGAASVIAGVGVTITRLIHDRRSLGGASTADAGVPNVLLLVLDTARASDLSVYGFPRSTSPNLAAFAADGVRFERAVATAPWTLPSHATIFTGLYPHELSTGWNTPLDDVPPTLAERFAERGYLTAGFVANFRYTSHEYGLSRGFQIYRDYALTPSQFVGSTMVGRRVIGMSNAAFHRYVLPGRKGGDRVVEEFLAFDTSRGSRPYFAFLNLFDPHEPYAPPAPYDRMFLTSEPGTRSIKVGAQLDTAVVRQLHDAYDGSLASADAALGRLFAELRARGQLDRTIIIVTSDHGEEFGAHGHLSHGSGLHMQALHVPLIIRWPAGGVPGGVVVPTPVSLRDLPATVLHLAGDLHASSFPGVSLAPLWADVRVTPSPIVSELYWVANQPTWYPVAAGNMHSLVRSGLHLIAGADAHTELYDVIADPLERHDLSKDPAYSDSLRALSSTLAGWPMGDRHGR